MRFNRKNRYVLLLALGCVVMLVAVLALTTTTAGGRWGVYLFLLLCPAMHFLMHRRMHHSDNQHLTPQAHVPTTETGVSVDERGK